MKDPTPKNRAHWEKESAASRRSTAASSRSRLAPGVAGGFLQSIFMCSARPALAEASRILKRGGLFAFCVSTPIRDISYEDHEDGSYGVTRSFQRSYGEWIRLFRGDRFAIEDLIELRPPLATETTHTEFSPLEWAREFPAEHIWELCRE